MSAAQNFESTASAWEAAGRPLSALLTGYALIRLRSWTFSEGAKVDGVSDTLRAFVKASEAALRKDWMDPYFDDRESCSTCGESYRFENVSQCTGCSRMRCFRCKGDLARALNGNLACPCGGEIVG